MKRTVALIMAATLLTAAVSGCGSVTGVTTDALGVQVAAAGPPSAAEAGGRVPRTLPAAVNDFGFDLARQLIAEGDNTVVSPLSVHAALSMTAVGARGITAEEMRDVLHLDPDTPPEEWGYANLLGSLYEPEGVTLEIANSIWAQDGEPFESPFLETNAEQFGAEIRSLDLQAPEAADLINGWVAEKTHDHITEIIDRPDPLAVMELVDAVYFLGDWLREFDPAATQTEPFTLASGEQVDVEMMTQSGSEWLYVENDELQMVRVPYANDSFSAYVLVPATEISTADALSNLNGTSWKSLVGSLDTANGSVSIPRFEIEWGEGADLSEALAAMGMPTAFNTDADFSGISKPLAEDFGLAIGRVLHKTYLRVDETGTEAAAATDVEIQAFTSIAPARPFELRADRPFIFTIVDDTTGTILFLGVIEDPRS